MVRSLACSENLFMKGNPYTERITQFLDVYEPLLNTLDSRDLTADEICSIRTAFVGMGWQTKWLMSKVGQNDALTTAQAQWRAATPKEQRKRANEVNRTGRDSYVSNERTYVASQNQYGTIQALFQYCRSDNWGILELDYPRDFIKSLRRVCSVEVPAFKEPTETKPWERSDEMRSNQVVSYIAACANGNHPNDGRDRQNETPHECSTADRRTAWFKSQAR